MDGGEARVYGNCYGVCGTIGCRLGGIDGESPSSPVANTQAGRQSCMALVGSGVIGRSKLAGMYGLLWRHERSGRLRALNRKRMTVKWSRKIPGKLCMRGGSQRLETVLGRGAVI